MKRTLCVLIGLALGLPKFADQKPVKFPVSLGLQGFEAGVFDVGAAYVSGQPSEEALRKLAKELGLTYVNVPLRAWQSFNLEALAKIAEAFEGSEGKVLYHCGGEPDDASACAVFSEVPRDVAGRGEQDRGSDAVERVDAAGVLGCGL